MWIKLKTEWKNYSEIISEWTKDSSESKEMCSYQASKQTEKAGDFESHAHFESQLSVVFRTVTLLLLWNEW